ncbi:uncharacterized protein LOC106769163 [Vigna radiata var. radiata]|uniref:Uncharacterized protein LOC106769163 n=1 Tax=Vigna radiata var. radiata TaxID=3916 RepID=A0A1S3UW11_VIGRR|nr:uncharacterized protein LOC106769163 [Vigna radiata var. radiata]
MLNPSENPSEIGGECETLRERVLWVRERERRSGRARYIKFEPRVARKEKEQIFASDIGCPIDELVCVSIVTNKPSTRWIDDTLSKLIPPVHNETLEGSGSNKNIKSGINLGFS